MSRPLNAAGVSLITSPVKSVRRPSVKIENLGRSTVRVGMLVNPLPWSVIVIESTTPSTTTAVPNAPDPPPPIIRTDTKL